MSCANLHIASLMLVDGWLYADEQKICKVDGESLLFVHKSPSKSDKFGQREIVVTLSGLSRVLAKQEVALDKE